ncbi:MAG: NAD(P)H-dependent oxidoreductase [Sphingobacteriales bacterium]|nr:MAG: NAD(P)H-dependent oxidoreductase [Sphingobacteriales bacterium]
MSDRNIKILAICGSLRSNSANIQIINYVASQVSEQVEFRIFDGLASIPPFDDGEPNDDVLYWRQEIRAADGIFICTPEYAFGVSGVLKNALDWTVSTADLDGKPIALVTAATGGEKAHAALQLTLNVISANNVLPDATLLISFVRSKINKDGVITDSEAAKALKNVINVLTTCVKQSLQ